MRVSEESHRQRGNPQERIRSLYSVGRCATRQLDDQVDHREGLITTHRIHALVTGQRSGWVTRPSALTVFVRDPDGQTSLAILMVGAIVLSLPSVFPYFDQPVDRPLALALTAVGVAMLVWGVIHLMLSIRAVRRVFVQGTEVTAEVKEWVVDPGDTLGVQSSVSARLSYRHGDKEYDERSLIWHPNEALRLLKAGDRVTLVLDPRDPRRFVLREAYEPGRVLLDGFGTKCDICGKSVRSDEYFDHMRSEHRGSDR